MYFLSFLYFSWSFPDNPLHSNSLSAFQQRKPLTTISRMRWYMFAYHANALLKVSSDENKNDMTIHKWKAEACLFLQKDVLFYSFFASVFKIPPVYSEGLWINCKVAGLTSCYQNEIWFPKRGNIFTEILKCCFVCSCYYVFNVDFWGGKHTPRQASISLWSIAKEDSSPPTPGT